MPRFRLPVRPRLKFALIGAAGGALILLPLSQVLRYQAADLQAVDFERARLSPMEHAVAVQRGLLAHRDVAQHVLRGRAALEPERRLRQAELDDRLRQLQNTLSAGWWMRALQESQALTADWQQLAQRVTLRRCSAADSQAAHQLLQEQAVQVMDLVTAAAPPAAGAVAGVALAGGRDTPATRQQRLAALEAALMALDAALLERQARTRAQQAGTELAAAAVLLLGLLLLARALRAPPEAQAPDRGVRRNHGRRAEDGPGADNPAHQLLGRLRSGALPHSAEPR